MKRNSIAALLIAVVFVSADRADDKKDNGKEILPGFAGIEADTSLLQIPGVFKITKAGAELNQRIPVVWWLLEVQGDEPDRDEIRKAWGIAPYEYFDKGPRILLKDADKVYLGEGQVYLQGFGDRLRKGDGVRVIMELPPAQVLERIRFVTISN